MSVFPLLTVPTTMLALRGSVRAGTLIVAEINQRIAAARAKSAAAPLAIFPNLDLTSGVIIREAGDTTDPVTLAPTDLLVVGPAAARNASAAAVAREPAPVGAWRG
jgi:hypothetical protein